MLVFQSFCYVMAVCELEKQNIFWEISFYQTVEFKIIIYTANCER